MEEKNNNKGIIILLVIIIVILSVLCVLFATDIISFKNNEEDNKIVDNNEEVKTSNIYDICDKESDNKFEIYDLENKTEVMPAMGGEPFRVYNVTTTVTKDNKIEHGNDYFARNYEDTVFVLYNNRLYFSENDTVISKYCFNYKDDSIKLNCDYSKINEDSIKEFDSININVDFKSIGTFASSGAGSPNIYAITTDGVVLGIASNGDTSNNYSSCEIMYDDSNYPIERIFKLQIYDGTNYEILLEDGTLINRFIDRENPVTLED